MNSRVFAAIGLIALAAVAAGAEDVPVMINGRETGSVYVYKVRSQLYLNAKQAVAAYGGNLVWQAVSGKIQLSVRGRQAQLTVDSKRARIIDSGMDIPASVMLRAGTVLVPLEFFSSEEFGKMSWTKTSFDPSLGRLLITSRSSVGPLRWFSYKGYTRIVAELDAAHVYSISRRGRNALDVTIPLGTVESAQDASLSDGLIESVRLRQESKLARLTLLLAESAGKAVWDARVFPDPRRLVIDVYRDAAALDRAKEALKTRPEPTRGDAASSSPAQLNASGTASLPGPNASQGAAPEEEGIGAGESGGRPATPAPAGNATPTTPVAARRLPESSPLRPVLRKIVIDPGHGGRDSGATGRRGVREKDINLLAAKELAGRLRKDGAFEVILTRDHDVFVPLAERSRMANDFGADLFVSLHCNANHQRAEKGFEIYFLSERASDPEAERVAEMENASLDLESGGGSAPDAEAALLLHALARTEFINDASVAAAVMSKALSRHTSLPDRGVKQAAFYVLRGTSAPAVLVEMGFVSNSSEESKLDSRKFRSKLAEGIHAGIVDFAKRQEWISASK